MKPMMKFGTVVGTGAAITVQTGFVPDYVRVTNLTDGDLVTELWHGAPLGFDSGSVEIKADMEITGGTSGAVAKIKAVVLTSGTWAGGDAAGTLILNDETISGTWANDEIIKMIDDRGYVRTTDAATVNGTLGGNGIAIAAAVASATGNAAVSAYAGTSAGNEAGFVIDSTVSESGKVLRWMAARGV